MARGICDNSETDVCVVVGFPHGTNLPATKAAEAKQLVAAGAAEVDMVANYGRARSGDVDFVRDDIIGVVRAAGVPVKVIFETAQLDLDIIRTLTGVCIEAGAAFVKTSTGFHGDGAQEDGVRAMLDAAEGRIEVKASGGIRDRQRAEMFLEMGVTRLGVNWSTCRGLADGSATGAGSGY
jgi:deoxyribose-phosphate aldolase